MTEQWQLPSDPFDIVNWMDWEHVPSCPCNKCEDFRRDNGLSCMFGLGPRPDDRREHNWAGQWMLAGGKINPQVSNPDSAPETGAES